MSDEVQVSLELSVSFDNVPAIHTWVTPVWPVVTGQDQEETCLGAILHLAATLVHMIVLHCLCHQEPAWSKYLHESLPEGFFSLKPNKTKRIGQE